MSLLLGLRLVRAGGRESLVRLAFTAVGVGLGLTLILLALTAFRREDYFEGMIKGDGT